MTDIRDLIREMQKDTGHTSVPDMQRIADRAEEFAPDRGYARPWNEGNVVLDTPHGTIATPPGKAEYLTTRHPDIKSA